MLQNDTVMLLNYLFQWLNYLQNVFQQLLLSLLAIAMTVSWFIKTWRGKYHLLL